MSPRAKSLLDQVQRKELRLSDLGTLLREMKDLDAKAALEEHFRLQFAETAPTPGQLGGRHAAPATHHQGGE